MNQTLHKLLTFFIAAVWLVNGLFFKILNLMPRHELIVARIVNQTYSRQLILLIGSLECLMVIWVLSGIKSRLCAIFQVIIIMTMNIMEFILVPDILMFGRVNLLVAIAFCILILYNEFYLNKRMEPAKS
jgi:hypothetical protein